MYAAFSPGTGYVNADGESGRQDLGPALPSGGRPLTAFLGEERCSAAQDEAGLQPYVASGAVGQEPDTALIRYVRSDSMRPSHGTLATC